MRDLQTAGRAVVDNPALPPTPVGQIESSAHHRRRRRMSIGAALATVIVLAAVAVGIGTSRQTSPKHVTVGPQGHTAVTDPLTSARLGDRPIAGVWQPTSITGYDGPFTSPPLPEPPRLELGGDDRWKGSDGCNELSGTYRVEKDHSFAIAGATTQTQVGCGSAKPSAASVPVVPTYAVLRAAVHLEIAGNQLTFTNSARRVLATYSAVDIPKPTSAACTVEPHMARDTLAAPTATRLSAPRTYGSGQIRLDPPAASDRTKIEPTAIWARSTVGVAKESTFEMVLARYSYLTVSSNALAWVVIGQHVPVVSEGPGPGIGTGTTKPSGPTCGDELDVFDANTGHPIATHTFGSN